MQSHKLNLVTSKYKNGENNETQIIKQTGQAKKSARHEQKETKGKKKKQYKADLAECHYSILCFSYPSIKVIVIMPYRTVMPGSSETHTFGLSSSYTLYTFSGIKKYHCNGKFAGDHRY